MHNLTFLRNAPIGRTAWRVLSVLFALLFGLSTQAAYAAVSLSGQAATVNQGNGNNTYAKATYDGSTLVDQKPGSTTAPAFDINTGTLILNGGTLTTTETGTSVVNGAFIDYILYDPSFNPVSSSSIQLAQTGVSGGVRTFSTSNAALSLIPLVQSAGAGYSLTISFRASYRNGSGGPLTARDDNGGAGYTASFDVTGTRTPAPTINPSNIQFTADGSTSSTSYYFPNTGTTPQFPGNNFTSSQNAGGVSGAFDINNGQLRLTNTIVTTTEAGPNTVSGVVLYYRTRLSTSGGGAFQAITLSQSGAASGGTRTFVIDPASASNTNAQPNLIATPAVTTTGNYVVDTYYQASGVNSSSGQPFTVTYPPTGYSSATFTVGGTPIATTIWTGAINDNWFDAGNWSNGVPTASTNALIRDLGAGNSVPYPNIYANTVRTTASGAVLYDNSTSGPAQTLNFTMGGSSQASRSIARLVVGQLQVFGNFSNLYDSYIQRENTITEFAGTNQTITGGSFVRVDISGGGVKTLQGLMNISEALNFMTPNLYTTAGNPLVVNPYNTLATNAGVLSTDITQPATNLVVLADVSTVNNNNGAQINGENDPSYLYGFIRATRQSVPAGQTISYGNMGMTLTFITNSPGNVEVTRNTVEAYTPLSSNFGIRRIFGVRPSDQATNSGGLTANMTFRYRNSETKRLDGSSTATYGTGTIPEERLTIFLSQNSGNTFSLIGRDAVPDTVNNTVTRTGVRAFATFTLGDTDHPLPVQLIAFNAVRNGANTLLTWTTASELNNKGFHVQVSTNGVEYREIAFVASQSPNSSSAQNYKYIDKEGGKAGIVYYRLQQEDFDGKSSYSPVRALNFEGIDTGGLALAVYPNPFLDTDEVAMTLASNAEGTARVTILDVAGHTVSDQQLPISAGSLTLGNLGNLHSGLYMARVTLADGTTKTVRLQKR